MPSSGQVEFSCTNLRLHLDKENMANFVRLNKIAENLFRIKTFSKMGNDLITLD